ncbi:hypothetical protein [Streptomyces sp. NPDC057689]|uniref:hypothetical protein n=1 Tax=Streptomyces sp. NPDC057689 TaxID=3346213 RepID=UPI0036C49873
MHDAPREYLHTNFRNQALAAEAKELSLATADFDYLRWVTGDEDRWQAWNKYFNDTQPGVRMALDLLFDSFHPEERDRVGELVQSVEVFSLPSNALESRVWKDPGEAKGYVIGIARVPGQIAAEIAWGVSMIHPRIPGIFSSGWDAEAARGVLDSTIIEWLKSLTAPGEGDLPQSALMTAGHEFPERPAGLAPGDYEWASMIFAMAHEVAHIIFGHLSSRPSDPGGLLIPLEQASLVGVSKEQNEEMAADSWTFVTSYNALLNYLSRIAPVSHKDSREHANREFRFNALQSAHRATEACQAFHSAQHILGLVAWGCGDDAKAQRLLSAAQRAPLVQRYIQQERQERFVPGIGWFMWTDHDVEYRKVHDDWRTHFCEEVMSEAWERLGLRVRDAAPAMLESRDYSPEALKKLAALSAKEFERKAASQTAELGRDHPSTLDARHELARRRGDAGDRAGAAAAYKTLVADAKRVLGADHLDTLSFRNNYACYLDDPVEVVIALEELLPDMERLLGSTHKATDAIRANLSIARERLQDAVDGKSHSGQGSTRNAD